MAKNIEVEIRSLLSDGDFNRLLEGFHRGGNVHHHAFTYPQRRLFADTDYFQSIRSELAAEQNSRRGRGDDAATS